MTFDEFIAAYEAKLSDEAILTLRFSSRAAYPGHPRAAADGFVQSLNMTPLGERWIDVAWDVPAHRDPHAGDPDGHLAKRLERTIVGGAPWFPPEMARQCANDFYGLFATGETIRLMSMLSARPGKDGSVVSGGNRITQSTFDAAYIAMDDENIGIICLEDED